jgi:dolichol-phosphate mannosyltransferase
MAQYANTLPARSAGTGGLSVGDIVENLEELEDVEAELDLAPEVVAIERLSVIMPVYNEETTVAEAIDQSLSVDLGDVEIELIVVNDGSNDGTRAILDSIDGTRDNMRIIHHDGNQGKGAAIRTGLPLATGTMVIIEDADLELDPNEYIDLISPIIDGEADVVFGSRFRGTIENMRWANKLANRILSLVASILYRTWITDEATCYKVTRTEVLRSLDLQCTGFEFCSEVTAKVLRNGYRYMEIPVYYRGREVHHGKKIRAWDGMDAIFTLLKYRFVK